MGTITVNVDDKTERRFRETVKREVGVGKGILGKAITEALNTWVEEKEQKEIAERMLKLLDKGFDLGGKLYKDRSELHERGS